MGITSTWGLNETVLQCKTIFAMPSSGILGVCYSERSDYRGKYFWNCSDCGYEFEDCKLPIKREIFVQVEK